MKIETYNYLRNELYDIVYMFESDEEAENYCKVIEKILKKTWDMEELWS